MSFSQSRHGDRIPGACAARGRPIPHYAWPESFARHISTSTVCRASPKNIYKCMCIGVPLFVQVNIPLRIIVDMTPEITSRKAVKKTIDHTESPVLGFLSSSLSVCLYHGSGFWPSRKPRRHPALQPRHQKQSLECSGRSLRTSSV